MLATALTVLKILADAGWLKAISGLLLGWLFPSPIQKLIDKQKQIRDAEAKADATGDVTDLDEL